MSRRYCPHIHGCLCGILFCQCWQYRLDVLLILPAQSSRHGYDAAYYELLGLELNHFLCIPYTDGEYYAIAGIRFLRCGVLF